LAVFDRILKEIPEGLVLLTPVERVEFKIKSVTPDKLVFSVGAKPTLIPIPKAIWNDIPDFLGDHKWKKIGVCHGKAPKGSLQEFIDQHSSRGTQHSADANYVASVLACLGIVDVDPKRPSKVRLRGK
jgi:hypothetical protein